MRENRGERNEEDIISYGRDGGGLAGRRFSVGLRQRNLRWETSWGKGMSGAAPGAMQEQKGGGPSGGALSGDKAMSPSGGQPAQSTEKNGKQNERLGQGPSDEQKE